METKETTEFVKDYTTTARVVSVSYGNVDKYTFTKASQKRIQFVIDKEIDTFDENGEAKKSNSFSINIFNLQQMLAPLCMEVQAAVTMAMGQLVNPLILAQVLTNSTISFTRIFHAKGEPREYKKEQNYLNNTYSTKITGIKTNMLPVFQQLYMQLLTTQPADPDAVAQATQSYAPAVPSLAELTEI